MEEDVNRGDEILHEMEPLLQPIAPTYLHFRVGRETRNPNKHTRFIMFGFKIFFCSIGLWGHQAWNYIVRVVVSLTCFYQAFFVIYSPDFTLCAVNSTEQTVQKDIFETSQIFYGVTSVAACISYVVFIGSFIAAKQKDSALMSPSQSLVDVQNTDVFLLFIVFLMFMVSSPLILYSTLDNSSFVATGVATICLAHLASVNTCHIFAISSLALGTFTQDSFRLIQNVQNGTLDDIIRIHEDLCTVVFNTASAFSVWFVLHWFTYGASVVFGAICISEEVTLKSPAGCIAYHAFVIAVLIYLFLLPCIYAAKITSRCADLCEKINCTTSADWNEGHPFRDRRNISLFISYAKDRRCGFKIGKITFNASLAWLSYFFSLTAFMLRFF